MSYYSSSCISEINRFRPIERHTFLETIVPKSSIKDQFGPLQTRNLEQLVPFLAINDHFVPKKHQSTFRFHQKEHKEEEQPVLAFQEGTVPKSRKGTAPKYKMCSKISLVKWEKAKKLLKDHFEEHDRMPKLHWTKLISNENMKQNLNLRNAIDR